MTWTRTWPRSLRSRSSGAGAVALRARRHRPRRLQSRSSTRSSAGSGRSTSWSTTPGSCRSGLLDDESRRHDLPAVSRSTWPPSSTAPREAIRADEAARHADTSSISPRSPARSGPPARPPTARPSTRVVGLSEAVRLRAARHRRRDQLRDADDRAYRAGRRTAQLPRSPRGPARGRRRGHRRRREAAEARRVGAGAAGHGGPLVRVFPRGFGEWLMRRRRIRRVARLGGAHRRARATYEAARRAVRPAGRPATDLPLAHGGKL